MKVVLIGDVGGVDGYHLGDEATLDVAIGELRRRGARDITVISGDPANTAARHGVTALARIGFPDRSVRADRPRDQRLVAVLALADGPERAPVGPGTFDDGGARERAELVIEAVGGADAVVVAGGGNLCSSWPEHLYERAALLSIARRAGVAAVVTGQTVGPGLLARQAALLAETLSTARVLGLRERPSYDLVASLVDPSTPRRLQLDDAVGLPDDAVPAFSGDHQLADGYLALSCNPIDPDLEDAYLDAVAALACRLHERSGLPVAFVPNVGTWTGGPTADVAVGEEIRRRLGQGAHLVVAPLLPARQAAALLRGASAIVSTRYHPVVLGLGAAVPCLAFAQDRYTAVKLGGALAPAGLAGWCLPLEMLGSELAGDVVDEFWDRREELVAHLATATAPWPSRHRAHWDELWQALTTDAVLPVERGSAEPSTIEMSPKVAGTGALQAVSSTMRDRAATTELRWEQAFAAAEGYAFDLEAALDGRSADLAAVETRAARLEADNTELVLAADELVLAAEQSEHAARSARSAVAEMSAHLDQRTSELTRVSAALDDASTRVGLLQQHLDALHGTKILRWTRPLRAVWGRLRRSDRQGLTNPGPVDPGSADTGVAGDVRGGRGAGRDGHVHGRAAGEDGLRDNDQDVAPRL